MLTLPAKKEHLNYWPTYWPNNPERISHLNYFINWQKEKNSVRLLWGMALPCPTLEPIYVTRLSRPLSKLIRASISIARTTNQQICYSLSWCPSITPMNIWKFSPNWPACLVMKISATTYYADGRSTRCSAGESGVIHRLQCLVGINRFLLNVHQFFSCIVPAQAQNVVAYRCFHQHSKVSSRCYG